MIYTKQNFERCAFNPLIEGKMLDEYPRLSEIILPEWTEEPLLDKIIRYTILIYDPKSQLIRDEPDLNHRRGVAFELAKIDDEEFAQLISTHTHGFIAELIVKYLLRFAKSKEFAAICAFEFKMWEAIQQIMKPITGKGSKEELEAAQKKSLLADEVEKEIMRLDKLYKQFFGDEELEKKAKKNFSSPELMAKREYV